MSGSLIAIFILIGFILIAVEIFIPGGIFGLLGTGLILTGVIGSAYSFGPEVSVPIGIGCVVGGILAFAAWVRYFPTSWMGRRLSLKNEAGSDQGFVSQSAEMEDLRDKTGEALTDLRPGGMVLIDGNRIDVVTAGTYIEKGSPVRVVEINSNRVVVAGMDEI